MKKGKFYLAKKEEYNYSAALEECIVDTCQCCIDNTFGADEEKQQQPIMMLGKIQSGKTRAFTGLIALAFDNDFDMVFILTKNSKALVQQTESRMKKEFKSFMSNNEIEVKNIIKMSYSLTGYQLEKKLIIISKKEKNNLNKLIEFIMKTVLVPTGEGYIGGEYYFIDSKQDDHPAQFLFQAVDIDEHDIVSDQKRKGKKSKIDDRRSFKEEDILVREDILPIFKKGIINFFVGAIVLREKNKKHYAYVIHTATQKGSHQSLKNVAETLLLQIKGRNEETLPKIEKLLGASYEDIQKSVVAYGFDMPTYETVRAIFYEAIDREYYRVDVVNSDKDVEDLLDEESGELSLSNPFSIFVGGQVLDRGVTISSLIGFYYGRSPITMQQDTVLQHSRMFGYRSRELLSVTRFYTTERIYSNMEKITEIDNELRDEIANGKMGNGIYFITQKKQDDKFEKPGRIIPCSPDKIRVSDVILLKPNRRIMPVGFTPISKVVASQIDRKICELLDTYDVTERTDGKMLSITIVEELLHLAYVVIKEDEDSTRFVDENEFITTMKYVSGASQQIPLIIRKDRRLSKTRQSGNNIVLSDSPDTPTPLNIAKRLAVELPVVMLIQESEKAEGWKNRPFWWPILVAPKIVPRTLFAAKLPAERIRKGDEEMLKEA